MHAVRPGTALQATAVAPYGETKILTINAQRPLGRHHGSFESHLGLGNVSLHRTGIQDCVGRFDMDQMAIAFAGEST